ncbi:MAG: SurA N-terminal domain-containing protein [Bradyrhizobiaceae bacterium]|nr:SurA N-terminal domain-containing protein [Bradyrhizobiaceae bacterium]
MLRGMRKASASIIGKGIMAAVVGFLILAFGIWGIGDIFRGYGRSSFAKVGNTEIGIEQFRQAYNDRLQQIGRELRRPITPQQAHELGIEQQIVTQLVAEAAIDEKARTMGLRLSNDEVGRLIMNDPAFRGPSGQFDRQRFEYLIHNAGYSEQRFTAEQRRVTLRRQVSIAIGGDLPAPKTVMQALDRFENEQRSVEFVILGPAQAGDIAPPTPEQLAKYFDERKVLFRAPEYRKVVLLSVAPADVALTIEVSDTDARRYYDDNRSRYGTPEKRQVEQIVFPNIEEAKSAADKLAGGGTTFEALATELGKTAGDINLGLVAKTDLIDPAIADAAFSLPEGGVNAPVKGRFGTALVHVVKIEPENIKPFAEMESEIRHDLALQRAKPAMQNLYDKVEDERASGLSLEEVGKKLKLNVRTIDAIDRSGRDSNGNPIADLPAGVDIAASAFSTDVGVENDPLQTTGGGYVWYDLVGITPSHDRTLDEVKDKVEASWRDDQIAERVTAKANDMLDRLKAGTPFAELAVAAGVKVDTKSGVQRARQADPLSSRAVDAAFRTAKGTPATAEGRNATERVVFVVTEITDPPFDPGSAQAQRYSERLRRTMTEELFEQYVRRLETDIGTTINQDALARIRGGSVE